MLRCWARIRRAGVGFWIAALVGPVLVAYGAAHAAGVTGGRWSIGAKRHERERRLLDSHRALWRTARIGEYRLRITRECTCRPLPADPLDIIADQSGPRRGWDTSRTVALELPRELKAYSVDGLFAAIEEAIAKRYDDVDVDYDPVLGYPRSIRLDPRRDHTGDERTVTVLGIEVLSVR
jgi:Family of unknown function (DUF6174)